MTPILEWARKSIVGAFARAEAAATMVEYALMLALIALIALSAVASFGGKVANQFSPVSATLGRHQPGGCSNGNGSAADHNPNC